MTAFRAMRTLLAGALLLAGATTAVAETRGPVTNLPIPRFVSMKAGEANVRRGPSLTHRVDWVFRHPGMPLIVTAEYGHWRRVVDREGVGGWIHYALLSGTRTVVVDADKVALRDRPLPDSPVRAYAEQGVIARLGDCEAGWCRISADGYRGWVPADTLWGLDPPPEPAVAQ